MGKLIILKNVRCSFPQLWHEKEENGQVFGRGITIILDKDSSQLKQVKATIAETLEGAPKVASYVKSKPHMVCLSEATDHPEYGKGAFQLKCNTPKVPYVLHSDMTRATEKDDPIFSGCYVNVKIEIWPQDNNFGKRVNSKLVTIQFAKEGPSFDGSYVSEEDALEGFEGEANLDAAEDDPLG